MMCDCGYNFSQGTARKSLQEQAESIREETISKSRADSDVIEEEGDKELYLGTGQKEKTKGYIRRHWRGQLSLPVSFWPNVFLLNIAVIQTKEWLFQIEHPQIAARVSVVFTLIALLVVYPWQIIGLWRCCNRLIEERAKTSWAYVARVVVVLGMLNAFSTVYRDWPVHRDLYRVGFEKSQYDDYTLELVQDDTMIHLTGGLGFGVSDDVANLLNQSQTVSAIILDSYGGRLYEGRELAKVILKNGLDTYSVTGCASACMIAFIAGKSRHLASGANLAFHQYQSMYEGFDPYFDASAEQEKDLAIFRQQGVAEEFLDRLYITAEDDLWYPTLDELREANVVHEVVNPSDIMPFPSYQVSSSEVSNELLQMSVYRSIKKYDLQTFNKIVKELESQIGKGVSANEIAAVGVQYLQAMAGPLLPITSNNALILFTEAVVDTLRLLEPDPILCLKMVYPAQYGSVVATEYLSREQTMLMMEAINTTIVDAYEKENPSVNLQSAENTIDNVVLAMGDNAYYLEPTGLQDKEDYKRACDAIIEFYELILAEDTNTASNTLRWAFSEN